VAGALRVARDDTSRMDADCLIEVITAPALPLSVDVLPV
jgi:hypothetical protein